MIDIRYIHTSSDIISLVQKAGGPELLHTNKPSLVAEVLRICQSDFCEGRVGWVVAAHGVLPPSPAPSLGLMCINNNN